jgi:hypothetical protein
MFRIGLLALALAIPAVAQQTVPGTFTTASPDHAVESTLPIVSTPTLTLSNGFSPPTVTMPQTITIEQPTTLGGGMPQSDQIPVNPATEPAPSDFNFTAVNPQSAFTFGVGSQSLGTLSRQTGKARVQPHKTYTNDDINRLTSQAAPNGIFLASLANGQPIANRNRNGFSPVSGIANMPEVKGGVENTEFAGNTNPVVSNPTAESARNATRSNEDQGQSADDDAAPTMPATDEPQPAGSNAGLAQSDNTEPTKTSPRASNQQLPATGSSLPFLGVTGMAALALGAWFTLHGR